MQLHIYIYIYYIVRSFHVDVRVCPIAGLERTFRLNPAY